MANLFFMVHLMATNLTDEQRITSGFCLLHHGGLSILGKELGMLCPVLPNRSTANSFCLGLK